MKEEIIYKCPNCKSEKRVCQEVFEEDRKAGWLGDSVKFGNFSRTEVPVRDPTQQPFPGKPLSVVTAFQDVCLNCGTIYTFMVKTRKDIWKQDVSKLIKSPLPPQDLPPGFFKNN